MSCGVKQCTGRNNHVLDQKRFRTSRPCIQSKHSTVLT